MVEDVEIVGFWIGFVSFLCHDGLHPAMVYHWIAKETTHFVIFRFLRTALPKTNMELEKHLFEKENHWVPC